jgi:hypothetical protein
LAVDERPALVTIAAGQTERRAAVLADAGRPAYGVRMGRLLQ